MSALNQVSTLDDPFVDPPNTTRMPIDVNDIHAQLLQVTNGTVLTPHGPPPQVLWHLHPTQPRPWVYEDPYTDTDQDLVRYTLPIVQQSIIAPTCPPQAEPMAVRVYRSRRSRFPVEPQNTQDRIQERVQNWAQSTSNLTLASEEDQVDLENDLSIIVGFRDAVTAVANQRAAKDGAEQAKKIQSALDLISSVEALSNNFMAFTGSFLDLLENMGQRIDKLDAGILGTGFGNSSNGEQRADCTSTSSVASVCGIATPSSSPNIDDAQGDHPGGSTALDLGTTDGRDGGQSSTITCVSKKKRPNLTIIIPKYSNARIFTHTSYREDGDADVGHSSINSTGNLDLSAEVPVSKNLRRTRKTFNKR